MIFGTGFEQKFKINRAIFRYINQVQKSGNKFKNRLPVVETDIHISMNKNKYLYIVLLCLMCFSCKNDSPNKTGFYYNTENFNIQYNETGLSDAERIFIHLLDMDDNGMGPEYHKYLKSFNQGNHKQGYIPVITISNRSFIAKTTAHREMMVAKSEGMLEQLCRQFSMRYNEIYVDCDWTPGTKNNYFAFLRSLHKISDKKISCAVRLRQLSNPGFYGIPPVDHVTIICCPDLIKKEKGTTDTLPDYNKLIPYLSAINNYPVKTDLALPLNRVTINNIDTKQPTYYVYGITPEEKDSLSHSEHNQKDAHNYILEKDIVFHGILLHKGSSITFEEFNIKKLKPTREFLATKIRKDYHLIYYGIDQETYQRHNQLNLN